MFNQSYGFHITPLVINSLSGGHILTHMHNGYDVTGIRKIMQKKYNREDDKIKYSGVLHEKVKS